MEIVRFFTVSLYHSYCELSGLAEDTLGALRVPDRLTALQAPQMCGLALALLGRGHLGGKLCRVQQIVPGAPATRTRLPAPRTDRKDG